MFIENIHEDVHVKESKMYMPRKNTTSVSKCKVHKSTCSQCLEPLTSNICMWTFDHNWCIDHKLFFLWYFIFFLIFRCMIIETVAKTVNWKMQIIKCMIYFGTYETLYNYSRLTCTTIMEKSDNSWRTYEYPNHVNSARTANQG